MTIMSSVKAVIIIFVLGVGYESIKVGKLALDIWLKNYIEYLQFIGGYFNDMAYMFGYHFLIVYLISSWMYTLFTICIIWFILSIIFNSK